MIAACSSGREIDVRAEDFSNTLEAEVERIEMPFLNGVVAGMVFTEHYLVVSLLKGDHFFAVFPYPFDGSYYYCGRRGRGPGELLDVDMKSIRAGGNDEVFFYDSKGKHRMQLSGSNAMLTSDDISPLSRLPNNGIMECFGGYANINLSGNQPEKEYLWVDAKADKIKYFSTYPSWNNKSNSEIPAFTYYKSVASSLDGRHLAAFYRNFSKCRFYNSRTERPKTVNVCLARKHYSGLPVPFDEYVAVLSTDDTSSEVQTWNWNGKPRDRMQISVPLTFISISPDGRTIIGYSGSNEIFYRAYCKSCIVQ